MGVPPPPPNARAGNRASPSCDMTKHNNADTSPRGRMNQQPLNGGTQAGFCPGQNTHRQPDARRQGGVRIWTYPLHQRVLGTRMEQPCQRCASMSGHHDWNRRLHGARLGTPLSVAALRGVWPTGRRRARPRGVRRPAGAHDCWGRVVRRLGSVGYWGGAAPSRDWGARKTGIWTSRPWRRARAAHRVAMVLLAPSQSGVRGCLSSIIASSQSSISGR